MEKQTYEKPSSEVIEILLTDVIAASGGDGGADTPINPEE